MNDFSTNYNNGEPLLPPMLGEFRDALANKQHRQKIFKSHLRLPKMVTLIPKKEFRKVCKLLGIEVSGEMSEPLNIAQSQMDLFDA
jgi:hypothetical protein